MSEQDENNNTAGAAGGASPSPSPSPSASDPNDFAAALKEATAAKRGDAPGDDGNKADTTASPKNADAGSDKTGADTAAGKKDDKDKAAASPKNADGAAGKSAGADDAAGKSAKSSPKHAEIKVDWSKVNPALKAVYDAADSDGKAAIEQTVKDSLARGQTISQLKSSLSKSSARKTPASTSSRSSRTATDLKKLTSGAAMTALEKDAPEVVAALKEITGPIIAELENNNRDLDRVAIQEMHADYDAQVADLAEIHPDWEKVADAPEFEKWLQAQGESIKNMVARNTVTSKEFPQGRIVDGKEAALVLTLYKQANGLTTAAGDEPPAAGEAEGSNQPSPTDKKRDLQRKSAQAPDVRGGGAASGIADDDFAGHLKAATRLKAQERQRQNA